MAGLLSTLSRKYEPSPRYWHISASCRGKVVVWGGMITDLGLLKKQERHGSVVEIFDPFLEKWEQKSTTGVPPQGLYEGACSSLMDLLYAYGGKDGSNRQSSLHCLCTSVMEWREVGENISEDGPMRKTACQMVPVNDNVLALFGGYGVPRGTIQPGSSFIRSKKYSDARGWTNEFHLFDVEKGMCSILVGHSSDACN